MEERHVVTVEPKTGYEIREELIGVDGGKPITMRSAYSPSGHHIGDEDRARKLCDEMGIAPELRRPEANTCEIGYSRLDGKWYGWSHRAIAGFSVGDEVVEGSAIASEGALPVGFRAEKLSDARKMAAAFADSVS
jgi:hypothetical protein